MSLKIEKKKRRKKEKQGGSVSMLTWRVTTKAATYPAITDGTKNDRSLCGVRVWVS